MSKRSGQLTHLACRAVDCRAEELGTALLALSCFFCILCSYYLLRPVRDEMGILGGVEHLHRLFTATFLVTLAVVPLFGAAAARLPRRQFLSLFYWGLAASLLGFYLAFRLSGEPDWVARGFYVWISVFNLLIVSAFWSVMSDLLSAARARRLFGLVAAGGSLGALLGPALTAGLAQLLGPVELLPVSAALLAAAVPCLRRLEHPEAGGNALGGEPWAGATLLARSPYLRGIALMLLLYTSTSTFLYFEQAHLVGRLPDSADRTSLFALMDLAVNALAMLCQAFVTARLWRRLGTRGLLLVVPLLTAAGFLLLGLVQSLAMLIVFQVLRRAGDYALMRPAREALFTHAGREARYKARNFIDTVVYRGGDAASGWLFAALTAAGLGLPALAFAAVPLAAAWAAVSARVGRHGAAAADVASLRNA